MRTFLLNLDIRILIKLAFFLILIFFPFFSYLVFEGTGVNPEYLFGFICFIFLVIRLLTIYYEGGSIIIPYYTRIFGLFTMYVILSSIFVSDLFVEKGAVKFFYSNSVIMTLVAFILIENTKFPQRWMNLAIIVLGLTLVLSAIVSIIQVYEPLFFRKSDIFVQGLSSERLAEYYSNNKNPNDLSGVTSRMLEGYRLSIYSYIGSLSVGIDCMAIFSLLIALKSKSWIKNAIFVGAAALVSFLSSARWIMLNFVVIASQNLWTAQNKIVNIFKYVLYAFILVSLLIPVLTFSGIDVQKFADERLADNSASTRILAFKVFTKVYTDSPFIGTGGITTPNVELLLGGRSSQIHVGYLKLFYYYGLIGGTLYLAFLFSLLQRMWKTARQSDYWGGFFAILAFCIANLTLVELSLFYYALLLALIFSNHFYNEKANSISSIKTPLQTRLGYG